MPSSKQSYEDYLTTQFHLQVITRYLDPRENSTKIRLTSFPIWRTYRHERFAFDRIERRMRELRNYSLPLENPVAVATIHLPPNTGFASDLYLCRSSLFQYSKFLPVTPSSDMLI